MDFTFRFFADNASGSSSVETAGTIANANQEAETAGALASLFSADGGDSFGTKDIFGTIDYSNMNNNFFANASQEAETAGTIACLNFGSFDLGGASVGGGDIGGACASVGADCAGGSFMSVC